MYLQGQPARRRTAGRQAGFALAAMLVAIAVLSVMLIVALPTWRHLAQREKEAELIFRGEQYARAIGLYQRKLAGALPPSLDILVEQKFLRRKYKDPITGGDFLPVYANTQAAGVGARQGAGGQPRSEATSGSGIVGVMSKSNAESIRLYNGRNRYDQWVFTYVSTQPGPVAPPGQGGQVGTGPGMQTDPGLRQPPPGRGRGGQ